MGTYPGSCHCGAVRLRFETSLDPRDIEVRACQCSFCIKHGARAAADPQGHLTISVRDPAQLKRYRFALKTADFLLCNICGVCVAAVTADDPEPRAVVIINVLDDPGQFTRDPVGVNFDGEDRAARLDRRRDRWMPVRIETG